MILDRYKKVEVEDQGDQRELRRKDTRKCVNFGNNNIFNIRYGNEAGMMRTLYMELKQLLNEREELRGQLGWVYPDKYK